jgi:hypothetical protein
MRKYYKPDNVRKRLSTQVLETQVSPWVLLDLYVEEVAGYFTWDQLCGLKSCIARQSVKSYLEWSSYFDALAQMYEGNESFEQVFAHRQVSALLKKFPFTTSDLDIDPQQVAFEKWLRAENQCRDTNERLKSCDELPRWVYRARQICSDILGELTPSLTMKIIRGGAHGPGSTLSSKGNRVSEYYKYFDLPYTCTKAAKLYGYAAISSDPKWVSFLETRGVRVEIPPLGSPQYQKELTLFDQVVELKDSDKLTFVPKDCRTDRPISVGASMNVFMQLGVKAYMQQRLQIFGVDLSDQTKNQLFAKLGSRHHMVNGRPSDCQFSTIDLESASDTLSISIVELILDPLWFGFLDDLRHKTTDYKGQTYRCSKFSAMGNGFTFPLETLIFYCVCKAAIEDGGLPCTTNDIAVYGDDIIVRKKAAPIVISALNWSGFSVNTAKSFISGWFKESCGEDYFKGINVRPIYLKRQVKRYADIYYLANALNLKTIDAVYKTSYLHLYSYLASCIPEKRRSFGPLALSECNFAVTLRFMNSRGLRPFLSHEERLNLAKRKLLRPDDVDIQSMYATYTLTTAQLYRARSDVKYMCSLRSSEFPKDSNPFIKKLFDVDDSESDSRFTARRNSTREVMQVLPVLNWNGALQYRSLNKTLDFLLEF